MCGTQKKNSGWKFDWKKKARCCRKRKKKKKQRLLWWEANLAWLFSLYFLFQGKRSARQGITAGAHFCLFGEQKKKNRSKSMKEVQSLFANIIDICRVCAKHEKPLLSACRVGVQHHSEGAAGSKPHTGAAMRGNRLTEVQPCPGFTSVSQLPVCVVCSQSRLTRRRRLAVYMCRCLQVDLRGLRVTWKTTSDWIRMNRNQTLQVTDARARDVRQISCKIAKSPKDRKCTENEPNCCTGKVKLDKS